MLCFLVLVFDNFGWREINCSDDINKNVSGADFRMCVLHNWQDSHFSNIPVGSYALMGSTQVVFFPTLSVYMQLLPIWDLWEIEFTWRYWGKKNTDRFFWPWMKILLKSLFFSGELLIMWRKHLSFCYGPSRLLSLQYGLFSSHGFLYFPLPSTVCQWSFEKWTQLSSGTVFGITGWYFE